MIGRLHGILLEKNPPQIVIEIAGIGYEVDVTMSTFYQLPALAEPVTLHIQQIFREDAHLLYGFISQDERHTFRELIKVNGIGAKIALAILSTLTSDELKNSIAQEDVKRLTSVPGVGKKTAERLVLELRDKLCKNIETNQALASSEPATIKPIDDVVNALLSLGYSEKEAKSACKNLAQNIEVGEGIRLALKGLSS